MRLCITEHAHKAILERVGAKPEKHYRLAWKAWNSSEPVKDNEISNPKWYWEHYDQKDSIQITKKLMGRLFVFVKKRGQDNKKVVLITVTPVHTRKWTKANAIANKPPPSEL